MTDNHELGILRRQLKGDRVDRIGSRLLFDLRCWSDVC